MKTRLTTLATALAAAATLMSMPGEAKAECGTWDFGCRIKDEAARDGQAIKDAAIRAGQAIGGAIVNVEKSVGIIKDPPPQQVFIPVPIAPVAPAATDLAGASAIITRMELAGGVPISQAIFDKAVAIVAAGGGNLVSAGGGNIVSAGGGNIVSAGGGNLVGPSGGTYTQTMIAANALALAGATNFKTQISNALISQDGGGLLAKAEAVQNTFVDGLKGAGAVSSLQAASLKASIAAGNNIVSAGGGNIVSAGGGNIVSAGGGNIVSAGGGNIVSAGGGNIVSAGGGNFTLSAAGTSAIVSAGGGNIVSAGGGNIVSAGGGNIVSAGGGNLISQDGAGVVSNDGGSAVARVSSLLGGSSGAGLMKEAANLALGRTVLDVGQSKADTMAIAIEAASGKAPAGFVPGGAAYTAVPTPAQLAVTAAATDLSAAKAQQAQMLKDPKLDDATKNFMKASIGQLQAKLDSANADVAKAQNATVANLAPAVPTPAQVTPSAELIAVQTASQAVNNASNLVKNDRAALDAAIVKKDQSLVGQLLAKLNTDTAAMTKTVGDLGTKVADVQTKGQPADKAAAQALFTTYKTVATSSTDAATAGLATSLATVNTVAAYVPTAAQTQAVTDANNAAIAAKAASDAAFKGLSFDRPADPVKLKEINQNLAVAGVSAAQARLSTALAGLADMKAQGKSDYEITNFSRDVVAKAVSDKNFAEAMVSHDYAGKRVDADVAAADLKNATVVVNTFKQLPGGNPQQLALLTDLQQLAQARADQADAIVSTARLMSSHSAGGPNAASVTDVYTAQAAMSTAQKAIDSIVSRDPAIGSTTNVTAQVQGLVATIRATPATLVAVPSLPSANLIATGGVNSPAIAKALADLVATGQAGQKSSAAVTQQIAAIVAAGGASLGSTATPAAAPSLPGGSINTAIGIASSGPTGGGAPPALSTNPGAAKPAALVNNFTTAANAIGFAQQFKKPDGTPDQAAAAEYIGKLAAKLSPEAMNQWVNAANGKGAPSPLAVAEMRQVQDMSQAEMARERAGAPPSPANAAAAKPAAAVAAVVLAPPAATAPIVVANAPAAPAQQVSVGNAAAPATASAAASALTAAQFETFIKNARPDQLQALIAAVPPEVFLTLMKSATPTLQTAVVNAVGTLSPAQKTQIGTALAPNGPPLTAEHIQAIAKALPPSATQSLLSAATPQHVQEISKSVPPQVMTEVVKVVNNAPTIRVATEQKNNVQQALRTIPGKLTSAEQTKFDALSTLVDRAATKGLTAEEAATLKAGLTALAQKNPKAEKQYGLNSLASLLPASQKPTLAGTNPSANVPDKASSPQSAPIAATAKPVVVAPVKTAIVPPAAPPVVKGTAKPTAPTKTILPVRSRALPAPAKPAPPARTAAPAQPKPPAPTHMICTTNMINGKPAGQNCHPG